MIVSKTIICHFFFIFIFLELIETQPPKSQQLKCPAAPEEVLTLIVVVQFWTLPQVTMWY